MQLSPRHLYEEASPKKRKEMSDIESFSAKEIEIDADGEDEGLLKRSMSPEPEQAVMRKGEKRAKKDKINGVKSRGRKNRHRSPSTASSSSSSSSRSRSRTRHNKSKRQLSRSRSRSPNPRHKHSRHDNRREYDQCERHAEEHGANCNGRKKSPVANKRLSFGDRENPVPNRCVGVFGLSLYTQERALWEVFGRYGQINEVQVVYDRQTGRSRGFAFVYFRSMDDAYEAKFRCDGMEIDGRKIRVDFSITEGPHPPTPGSYLGRSAEAAYSARRLDRRPASYQRAGSPISYGYRRSYSPDRKYY
ncbi:hypothetical protein ACOMHN_048591 [Nucella lapillus]